MTVLLARVLAFGAVAAVAAYTLYQGSKKSEQGKQDNQDEPSPKDDTLTDEQERHLVLKREVLSKSGKLSSDAIDEVIARIRAQFIEQNNNPSQHPPTEKQDAEKSDQTDEDQDQDDDAAVKSATDRARPEFSQRVSDKVKKI